MIHSCVDIPSGSVLHVAQWTRYGTCMQLQVADRLEGTAVSVDLWGDLCYVLLVECYLGYQMKENEMGRACGTQGVQRNSIEDFGGGNLS